MKSSNTPRKSKNTNSSMYKIINSLSAVGKASHVLADSAKRSVSPEQNSMYGPDENSINKIASKFISTPNRKIEEQETVIKTLKAKLSTQSKMIAEGSHSQQEKEHMQKNLLELKEIITKTTDDYNKIVDSISTKITSLTNDNNKLNTEMESLRAHNKNIEVLYESAKNYSKLEQMITLEKSINTEVNTLLSSNYQKYADNYTLAKTEKEKIACQWKEAIQKIEIEREEHRKALSNWVAEKSMLLQQIQELTSKNERSDMEISRLSELNKSYESQIAISTGKIGMLEDELKEKKRQDELVKELTKSLADVQTRYSMSEKKFEEERKQFGGFELKNKLDNNLCELNGSSKKLNEVSIQLQTTKKELDIAQLRLNVILPKEKVISSIEQQLTDANEKINKINESNLALQNELKKMSDEYTNAVNILKATIEENTKLKDERSILENDKSITSLEKVKLQEDNQKLVEENNKVIKALRSLKEALAEGQKYVGDPKDILDCKLSEALSKFLKDNYLIDILFTKLGDGNYQVGTKKYIMKLDAKENLIVRAGTGYVTIQEFIKVFLPPELEKLKKAVTFKSLSTKLEKVQSYLALLTDCIKSSEAYEPSIIGRIDDSKMTDQ